MHLILVIIFLISNSFLLESLSYLYYTVTNNIISNPYFSYIHSIYKFKVLLHDSMIELSQSDFKLAH